MSVAFRRESDEEHKEPRFERPIPSGPNYVTPRGLKLIADKVAELEATLAVTAEQAEREAIARDLRYWHTRQVTAIEAPAPPQDEVAFGSRLRIRTGSGERTIKIVGDDEADPTTGRIPFSAPLSRALVGAAEGDRIDFGAGVEVLEILEPEP
jgi:transcription elongation GreA/GreB family factor